MTLAGPVIGTCASTFEELSDGLKLLATTGGGLMEMINKVMTADINSAAEARKLADELLFSSGKMGFDLLMDFLCQKSSCLGCCCLQCNGSRSDNV